MPVAPACLTWASVTESSGPNQRQVCFTRFGLRTSAASAALDAAAAQGLEMAGDDRL